jgi:hypothetical protein
MDRTRAALDKRMSNRTKTGIEVFPPTGCAAETRIRSLYLPELDIGLFALALSALETEILELLESEMRRW